MKLQVTPSLSLYGEVQPPGDKSISHRVAILAAMANGQSRFDNFLDAGVTRVMLSALSVLGATTIWEEGGLIINSPGWQALRPPQSNLSCGNSATTMRLLAGALAAANIPATLDGSPALCRRPMGRLVSPLAKMGVPISATSANTAPLLLTVRTSPLKGQTIHLDVASAQVKTALLLAGLAADGPTMIYEPGPSRNHTENLLAHLGANILIDPTNQSVTLTPSPAFSLPPFNMTLPGDFSAAAFLLVAALITPGSSITIKNVGLNPTRTGLIDVLLSMGARIEIQIQGQSLGEPYGTILAEYSNLTGTLVNGETIVRMIDEFPAFAAAAACAIGQTTVTQAEELRHKESDRIRQLCTGLNQLGVSATEQPDGFTIVGNGEVPGGQTDAGGDHRLAMAYGILGLASRHGVSVSGAEVIHESFPDFAPALSSLGACLKLQ